LSDVVRSALAQSQERCTDLPVRLGEIHDPVIAQGDAKTDNMLWDGSRVRLIDFEGFGVGDLAFEVADLAEHISARLCGIRDPRSLVEAFSLTPAQLERVASYRVVLATFWLLMLLSGNPGHGLNPDGSAESQAAHLLDLLKQEPQPN
jgi:thiamine kinase-like enzyme